MKNTSIVNVQDKEVVTTQTISQVEILEGNIQLGQSVRFPVKLLDSNSGLISVEFVEVSGEEYLAWGTDDSYINNLILTKLGLTALV
jgi:hypothetical protein